MRLCRNEIKEITQKIVVAKEEARIAAELADKKAARAQVSFLHSHNLCCPALTRSSCSLGNNVATFFTMHLFHAGQPPQGTSLKQHMSGVSRAELADKEAAQAQVSPACFYLCSRAVL